MKATVVRNISIYNDAISEGHQVTIQEFIQQFGEKFIINWKRDNSITVRNRHNKKNGANLQITFVSRHVAEVNPDQMKLFETDIDKEVEADFEVTGSTTNTKREDKPGKQNNRNGELANSNIKELTNQQT